MASEASRDSRDSLASFSPSSVPKSKSEMKKGPWTTSEDMILVEYVKKHGEGNWNAVQKYSGLMRCGKSCRLRWANHLRPNLKKCAFSKEEEKLIVELHAKLGNKWARMATQLPGRTDNEIKNYWNTRLKRRLRSGLPIYPQEVLESPNPNPNPNPSPFYKTPLPILPRQINNPQLNLHQKTSNSSFSSYPLGIQHAFMERNNSLGSYGIIGLPLIQSPVVAPTTAPPKVVVAAADGELGFPKRTGLLGDVFKESEALAESARKSDEKKFIAMVGNQNTHFASEDSNKNEGGGILVTPGEGASSMEDDLLSQLLDNFPLSVPIPEWNVGHYKSKSEASIMVNGTTSMMQGQLNGLMYNPGTVKGNMNGSCIWNDMPSIY